MRLRWAFLVDSVPFTQDVIDGKTSLGGSESTCLGTARALAARGHHVHIFATKLDPNTSGMDAYGCAWHPFEEIATWSNLFHWDVVVGLRIPGLLERHIRARYRILWNQDLLNGEPLKHAIMAIAWNLDRLAYVSEFHRQQWQDWLPDLTDMGWVTRNGFDPAHVPTDVVKDPNVLIHISRPERGLAPLLMMWPQFKQDHPNAVLKICRYSSMYDAKGWGQVCAAFDEDIKAVSDEVGGIEWLGELNKPDLYRAIAGAAAMWYPGVPEFAETSCIAAVEAQACGTPFVGSYKGALPETVPSGYLVRGDAFSEDYQKQSMAFVADLMEGCRTNSKRYRLVQEAGRDHVKGYTYDAIAEQWEQSILEAFEARYESNRAGVMRALAHEDDLLSAKIVAGSLDTAEAREVEALCDRISRGDEHTAEHYSLHSMDTLAEMKVGGRIKPVVDAMQGRARILDVACGNGCFALALAQAYPDAQITALDFSQGNIDKAKAAAETLGVTNVEWVCDSAWDFPNQQPSAWLTNQPSGTFDGLWVGEFIEHVADCTGFIDAIERVCVPGAQVVYTCPAGPITMELCDRRTPLHRSHVHHFTHEDCEAVWGQKQDIHFQYLYGLQSPTGNSIGSWFITYVTSDAKAGRLNHADRILKTRPRLTVTAGILAHNAEHDLGRCLETLWPICDEILIGDTGSADKTKAIAAQFSDRKIRVIDLPRVEDHPDGFAGARNALLQQAAGDWFLWMDTDEVLVGNSALRPYLETGGPFLGFALKQNHFQLDAPFHFDTPTRVFRTNRQIQFYGCVHEQPQLKHCNGDIYPSLQLEDAQIAHFGYLSAGVRKQKAFRRNRPLLLKDRERFPDRKLGKVLWLRQLVQDVDEIAPVTGVQHSQVRNRLKEAVHIFQSEFADPADIYHPIARPFYERALQVLEVGTEVELAFAGRQGGLKPGQRAKPTRVWVADATELETILKHQTDRLVKGMASPIVRVDPYVPESVEAVPV